MHMPHAHVGCTCACTCALSTTRSMGGDTWRTVCMLLSYSPTGSPTDSGASLSPPSRSYVITTRGDTAAGGGPCGARRHRLNRRVAPLAWSFPHSWTPVPSRSQLDASSFTLTAGRQFLHAHRCVVSTQSNGGARHIIAMGGAVHTGGGDARRTLATRPTLRTDHDALLLNVPRTPRGVR